MSEQLIHLSPWFSQVTWSLLVVLSVSLIGRLLTRAVDLRLRQWASRTPWKWDDAVVEAVKRCLPSLTFLYGLYVATGFWDWSDDVRRIVNGSLYVLTWLVVTVALMGLAGKLVSAYSPRFQHAMPMTSLTENLAKLAVAGLGILTVLHGLGIPIAPLLTALGVGGLAVALALQDTLSNLFSGFYLTMSRHVRVGDYVKLESGQEGYVEDIGWRAVKIRMLPNNMVVVPNNKLSQAIIVNYYLPNRELAVLVEVGVDYGSDLEQVERVTSEVGREVMRTVPGGTPEFEPFIRYHGFGNFSIQFTVVLRAREFVDQYLIKHEFIKRLHARYAREGIVIPFPIQTVYTRSTAQPADASS